MMTMALTTEGPAPELDDLHGYTDAIFQLMIVGKTL